MHKTRNILDYLSDRERPWAQAILRRAYQASDVKTAQRLLLDLARRLETEYPSAAESMREGLDETLTVLTLKLSARLRRSLPNMTDDDVRRELSSALVNRLRDERRKDTSLNILERVSILALDRNGHAADIDQGNGQRVLQGAMKWRKDEDVDAPFNFTVVRSADKKRLEMKPGPQGGFDAIVDDIVTTFMRHSAH